MEGNRGSLGLGLAGELQRLLWDRDGAPRTGTDLQDRDRALGQGQSPRLAPATAGCPRCAVGCAPTCCRVPPPACDAPSPPQDITPVVLWDTPSIYQSAPGGSPNNPLGRCPGHFAGCPPPALGHPPGPSSGCPQSRAEPPVASGAPPGLHQAPWLGGVRAASRCRGGGDSRRGARQPPAL